MRRVLATLLASLLFVSFGATGATWNITYPRPFTDFDTGSRYPMELLRLALDQTGVKYKLVPSDRIMLQSRALKQLAENRTINVVWSMTDQNRERDLLPVRIPIYKGLIGWRVLLINKELAGRLQVVNSIEALREFKAIQGYDWPDTKILQSNGFEVVTSKDHQALFSMLEQSRGDFFPRSLVEVWEELEVRGEEQNVMVESHLGVRYPTAMYYFFNKRNVTLANLVEKGLEKAIANGKFDELFAQIHQQILNKAQMDNRLFFELENPLLPEGTPLDRKELWYQQGQ